MILKHLKHKPDDGKATAYDVVPSGSTLVNDLIGGSLASDGKNMICPGYPRRKITEIFGSESSGKTTAALQALAEVQKAGGWALYLDYEHAVDKNYARKIGVTFDQKRIMLYQPATIEEGFNFMYIGIIGGADLIVVDSVAAMIPKKEIDAKMDDEAQIGLQARAFSRHLPKLANLWLNTKDGRANPKGTAIIFINQTRSNIGGGPGADVSTPGGRAIKFYAALRLQFSRLRSESVKKKDKFTGRESNVPFGNHTRVKVVKNKMEGKQGHTSDIFIRFNVGIDEFYSLIEAAVINKVVKKEGGGYYTYENERWQGREKFRAFLQSNPPVFQAIRKAVLEVIHGAAQDADDDDDDGLDLDQLITSTSAEDEEAAEVTPDAPEEVTVSSSDDSDDSD